MQENQGESCSKSQREEIKNAPREELESFDERKGGKLSELSARAWEDLVKKQCSVYARQLSSPIIEAVLKDWLAVSCGDAGKRRGEEDGQKSEAAVAEGGMRKKSFGGTQNH